MGKFTRTRTKMKAIARQWTPFVQIPVTEELLKLNPLLANAAGVYQNSRLQVEIFNCESDVGGTVQVVVRRHTGDTITWDELQRAKNELFTMEHCAVEFFPPEDASWRINREVRILWILPLDFVPPFGNHLPGAFGQKG